MNDYGNIRVAVEEAMYEELLYRFATWQGLPPLFPPIKQGHAAPKAWIISHHHAFIIYTRTFPCFVSLIVRVMLVWLGVGAAAVIVTRRL